MGGHRDRQGGGRPPGRDRLALPDAGVTEVAQVQPLVEARDLDRAFDYAVPAGMAGAAVPGALVACPLGPRRVLGVVVGRGPATHEGRLVELAGVVAAEPVPPDLLELALWVARYYMAPVAACLRLVLPPGADGALRRGRDGEWRLAAPPTGPAPRLVASLPADAAEPSGERRRAVVRTLAQAGGRMPAARLVRAAATTMPTLRRMAADGQIALAGEAPAAAPIEALGGPAPPPDVPPEPTGDQRAALDAVRAAMGEGLPLLLHGVTGSGKTEVYLRAIEEARARGRGSLVLVPEIALTPQLLRRLRARLGEGVAIWHSALSPAERASEHGRVRRGEADVVLGARSAVFAPVARLGLVVVDEEHDPSYKQDSSPRYDARQVAARRARAAGAAVVYGTATPRPETWRALPRHTLGARPGGAAPPRIEVVDMRLQGPGPVSRPLASALHAAAARGEKAVLLSSRRGFALMALCRACGWIARCPRCDVSLVHHEAPPRLACHHCGHEEPVPGVCPRCHAADVARQGSGAQGLERALRRLVPRARLVRMDGSTASGRGAVGRLLDRFAAPGAAILLGTQMVAKGHDLPEVTVAGAIDADAPLQHADFRSEERAFGLIVQLAGRAGRRGEPARVIVQAYEPEARAVRLGARQAVAEFLDEELARRRAHDLPPHSHLVRVVLEGQRAAAVAAAAADLAGALRAVAPALGVLGPAPLHRLRGRTRRALLLRGEWASAVTVPLRAVLDERLPDLRRAEVRAVVDVDPQDT
ncbi:MAG: primosomal protein N' [Thermoleophilia bacterium]